MFLAAICISVVLLAVAAAGVVADVRYLRRRVDVELPLAGYVPGRRRAETGLHGRSRS